MGQSPGSAVTLPGRLVITLGATPTATALPEGSSRHIGEVTSREKHRAKCKNSRRRRSSHGREGGGVAETRRWGGRSKTKGVSEDVERLVRYCHYYLKLSWYLYMGNVKVTYSNGRILTKSISHSDNIGHFWITKMITISKNANREYVSENILA